MMELWAIVFFIVMDFSWNSITVSFLWALYDHYGEQAMIMSDDLCSSPWAHLDDCVGVSCSRWNMTHHYPRKLSLYLYLKARIIVKWYFTSIWIYMSPTRTVGLCNSISVHNSSCLFSEDYDMYICVRSHVTISVRENAHSFMLSEGA